MTCTHDNVGRLYNKLTIANEILSQPKAAGNVEVTSPEEPHTSTSPSNECGRPNQETEFLTLTTVTCSESYIKDLLRIILPDNVGR